MTERAITMLQLRLMQVYPPGTRVDIDTHRPGRDGKIVKTWWLAIDGIIKMKSFDSYAALEKYANWLIFVKSDEDLDPEIPFEQAIKGNSFDYPKNRIKEIL